MGDKVESSISLLDSSFGGMEGILLLGDFWDMIGLKHRIKNETLKDSNNMKNEKWEE